ncbi:hypothetical protein [Methylocapsa acidiphila]|nr:hypothetical protein [Methylocapsa acidiphila]
MDIAVKAAETSRLPKRNRGAAKGRSVATWLVLAGATLTNLLLWGRATTSAEPCSVEGQENGAVKSVDERLELELDSGDVLKIAGVLPPAPTPTDPDLDAKSRDRLTGWLRGQAVSFHRLDPRPDRWGRAPAVIFATVGTPNAAPVDVGAALLDAGLGRFDPAAGLSPPCRAALLAAEAAARAAALGVWSDPYYSIIAASDRESFREKAGTSVIVEGRVSRVDIGSARTTLFYGPRRNLDFSVTILTRNIKRFESAGLDPAQFSGRLLRVRGLLEMRFGPQIEVSDPDEIELIAQDQDAVATRPPRSRR